MRIQQNVILAPYTTFKIGGPAKFFCIAKKEEDIVKAVRFAKDNKIRLFILGEGSNVLIADRGFPGLVIKIEIKGLKKELSADGKKALLTIGAGEMWDEIVEYSVNEGLYGIENLSAIPGTVGAAPVQNIGAYGADISSVIYKVRAYDTKKLSFVELSKEQCKFEYRDSIFKKSNGRYIITTVTLALALRGKVDITYKELKEYLQKKAKNTPTLSDVREAVVAIRWNKLPDWKLWGTAGSFFKNPIISRSHFKRLSIKYPEAIGFEEPDGKIKVSLGWILDKVCGMKGVCVGNVCTYEKQALVLVTKPGATAEEVVGMAKNLMKTVKNKTGIEIEGEVQWVN